MIAPTLVLSCEHGGNTIPPAWQHLFRSAAARRALAAHSGWDPGSADATRAFAAATGASASIATTSRLLVDLNRSLHHPRLFSMFSKGLDQAQRTAVLAEHWHPHRDAVTARIRTALAPGDTVLHLAVHSFDPALDPAARDFDVGLLYDPGRPAERAYCAAWAAALRRCGVRVRRNQPYRGAADGFCTALRQALAEPRYLGVELELNQGCLACVPEVVAQRPQRFSSPP